MSLEEMQARCDAATPGPLRYTPAVEACGHIIIPKMREDATGAYVHWPEHEKALARLELLEAALRVAMEGAPSAEHLTLLIEFLDAEQAAGRWRGAGGSREVQQALEGWVAALTRVNAILEGK